MTEVKEIDRTRLRYVLYARRSTTDEGSQQRSLGDQEKHCKRYAESRGLNIVDVIKEKGSAKRPNEKVRPKFAKILKDIEAGKYDAILSYAPDRLTRNMLEGGYLINMIDDGVLKDMQFPTHHFTNDPTGKLTLGIMFSISKHFADDLSSKIKRGVDGNFEDGKSSGTPKWGYNREGDGYYRPNRYFDKVREAWYLRAEGSTNKEITEYLIENGVHRLTKINKKNNTARRIEPSEKSVGSMFSDSFYYGVFVQTLQTVDLTQLYNFEPMISEDLFNEVQTLAYERKRDINPKKQTEFKPLLHMVHCGVCKNDKWMVAGKNKPGGSQHHVLSYRCDNPECTRTVKSVRAYNIFNAIYERLDSIQLTDEAYARYGKRLEGVTDEKILKIKYEIKSKQGVRSHHKNELDSLSLGLHKIDKDSAALHINNERINVLAIMVQELDGAIDKLERKIENPNKIRLSRDEFLNLIKKSSVKMKAGNAIEKDRLARILFLNLTVDNEKGLSIIWKEPFADLVEAIEISSGTDERT